MISFNGTKEEEVQVLRHLLTEDASISFKGPLNLILKQFVPRMGLNETLFEKSFPLLYNPGMSDDCEMYIAILDLLETTFCVTVVDTNIDNCRDSNQRQTEDLFIVQH